MGDARESNVGRAAMLVVVALAAGLLVYWLASPRYPAPSATPIRPPAQSAPQRPGNADPSPSVGTPVGTGPLAPVPDAGPIAPPQSEQEKERDTLDRRRRPLYAQLHQVLAEALVAVRPSDDDGATLDLYAAQDAPGNTVRLLALALRCNIGFYGFRHIRFYAPNPPQSIERYRLDAEANSDGAGNWQTFKK